MKKALKITLCGLLAAMVVVPVVVSNATKERSAATAVAPQERERELSEKHRQRIERREARQAAYEHFLDSTILSHNYRFIPASFNVEPAGGMQMISNPQCELAIYSGYADIFLPYYTGFVSPYRLNLINSIITVLNGYTAIQTDNGWTITFNSWLYSANDYTFTLYVNSKSGSAQLNLSSSFYPSTSYWGSIMAVY